MPATRTSINLLGFVGGVFATVLLTKLASYLTPYKLYFSFSSFMYSENSVFRWESLTIKLAIPSLVGFLLFYLPFKWMQMTRGSRVNYRNIYRYLAQQAALTARAAGFFAALLLAWPFIVFWDVLQVPILQHLQFQFVCVYFLYFVSFSYFAGLGVDLAKLLLHEQLPQPATQAVAGNLAWLETVRTSLMGIVTSGIATYFAAMLGRAA